MAELSDSNSSKTWPVRIIAITDGASLGLIDTDRIWPTTSSCGTVRFSRATTAIQPTMIGIDNRRIHFAKPVRRVCSAAGAGSIVGALTRMSADLTYWIAGVGAMLEICGSARDGAYLPG